jgi:DnaJ-class molecular chaperone
MQPIAYDKPCPECSEAFRVPRHACVRCNGTGKVRAV